MHNGIILKVNNILKRGNKIKIILKFNLSSNIKIKYN